MKSYQQFILESKKKSKNKPDLKPDANGFYSFQAIFGKHSGREPEPRVEAPRGARPVKESLVPSVKPLTPPADNGQEYNPHDYSHNSFEAAERHEAKVQVHSDKLAEHYKITDHDHKYNLAHYTRDSEQLNKHLIAMKGKGASPSIPEHHETQFHLDNLLHSHKTPEAMTVHTGTAHSPEHYPVDEKTGKRHMIMHAYTSTSIHAGIADGFGKQDSSLPNAKYPGKHVLNMHLPKDHPGAFIRDHSRWQSEHEFLMPRNTRMHVASEPKTYHSHSPFGDKQTTHVWDAHVLPHEGHE